MKTEYHVDSLDDIALYFDERAQEASMRVSGSRTMQARNTREASTWEEAAKFIRQCRFCCEAS